MLISLSFARLATFIRNNPLLVALPIISAIHLLIIFNTKIYLPKTSKIHKIHHSIVITLIKKPPAKIVQKPVPVIAKEIPVVPQQKNKSPRRIAKSTLSTQVKLSPFDVIKKKPSIPKVEVTPIVPLEKKIPVKVVEIEMTPEPVTESKTEVTPIVPLEKKIPVTVVETEMTPEEPVTESKNEVTPIVSLEKEIPVRVVETEITPEPVTESKNEVTPIVPSEKEIPVSAVEKAMTSEPVTESKNEVTPIVLSEKEIPVSAVEKAITPEPVTESKNEVTPIVPSEKEIPVSAVEKAMTPEPVVEFKNEVIAIVPAKPIPVEKPKEPIVINAKTKIQMDAIFPLEPISKAKEMPIKIDKISSKKPKITAKVKSTDDISALSLDNLSEQITQVAEKYAYQPSSDSENRTKTVKSVVKQKASAEQYGIDWQAKVERMGNRNYPQVARQQDFSAKLIMEVAIKADGSVAKIHIKKSSGISELDEAAKKIVRMGEPYPPLPSQLAEELDVLVIKRTWLFSDEAMRTQ